MLSLRLALPQSLISVRYRRHVPLVALAVAGVACTPFKIDPPGAAADAGACPHRAPPPKRPTVMDTGANFPDFVLAQSTIFPVAGLDDAGQPLYGDVGFDLDDTCTDEGQGPSCAEPGWANASHKDGRDGIDNAWGQSWGQVVPTGPTSGDAPVMLFRVSSYSGQPDDDQVEVSLYVGLGLAPREDAGDGGSSPLWDGYDRWDIMREMLVPSASPTVDQPLFRDEHAYVSGGTLVANFVNAAVTTGFVELPYVLVPASQVVVAGQLTRDGGLWKLKDAVLATRIRFDDELVALAQAPDNLAPGETNCQNASMWRLAQQSVCPYVDIASVPGLPSSAPCDSLSGAGRFEATQSMFGDVRLPSPPPDLNCLPGINPATDTCEPVGD